MARQRLGDPDPDPDPDLDLDLTAIAAAIAEAGRRRSPIPAAGLTEIQAAYRIQRAVVRRRTDDGAGASAGYKVALTSTAAQEALHAAEPASGELLASDVRPSGSTMHLGQMFTPLIEVELIFRIVADLPPNASAADVAERCDVAAGLECPDGRFVDWFGGKFPRISLGDVVADNCLVGAVVVGDNWRPARDLDLAGTSATLSLDAVAVGAGTATAVLGNPINAIAWLSSHLAGQGRVLEAGSVVASGTLTAPLIARPGWVRAEFDTGLGEVAVEIVA